MWGNRDAPLRVASHDPLCRQQYWNGGDCFDCRLIAKVRADERERKNERYAAMMMALSEELLNARAEERERIAEALEYEAGEYNGDPRLQAVTDAFVAAARIARNGGTDD